MIDALCRGIGASAGVRVVPVKPLDSRGSIVWRVRFGSDDAVLTLRDSSAVAELPSLRRELAIYRRVAAEHLAPALLWADDTQAAFIARYVSPAPDHVREDHRALGTQLAGLHRIPLNQFPAAASLVDIARRYLMMHTQQAAVHGDAVSARLRDRVAVVEDAASPAHDDVMCHRDLVATNVLYGDRPLLIDWEYAGAASRWLDIATLIDAFELAPQQVNELLDGYLQGSGIDMALPDIHAAVARQRSVYRAVSELWQAALPAVS